MKKLKKKFNAFYKIVKETCPSPYYSNTGLITYYTEIVDHELSPAILLKNRNNPGLDKKILLLDELEPYKWFCSYLQYLNEQAETTLLKMELFIALGKDEKITSLEEDFNKARDYFELAKKLTR